MKDSKSQYKNYVLDFMMIKRIQVKRPGLFNFFLSIPVEFLTENLNLEWMSKRFIKE